MALDQRKVSLIAEFLRESFVGCYVFYHEDEHRVAETYRIVNATTAKTLHLVSVSRAFLDDHAEADLVPTLQSLELLVNLRRAGGHRVFVRSQIIEIDFGCRGVDDGPEPARP
jgi:hypothetical protein